MKRFVIKKVMVNRTDGYYQVVVEHEVHLNRTIITSTLQYFTTQGGYDYCHPREVAMQNAQAIANGLNELEKIRKLQRKTIISDFPIDETFDEPKKTIV